MLLTSLIARPTAQPDSKRRDGNYPHPVLDRELLQYCQAEYPGSRSQGDHAPAGRFIVVACLFLCFACHLTRTPRRAIADFRSKVNFSRDSVQQRLVTSLYKPDLFAELLFEDETLVTERARVKSLLDAYKEGFRVLSEVSLKST